VVMQIKNRKEQLLRRITDRNKATPTREELKSRALAVSGRFRSGLTDLSTEHDRYLEEAFGAKEK
jgi:hypothetical protein